MTYFAYISVVHDNPVLTDDFKYFIPERADEHPWAKAVAQKKAGTKTYILNLDNPWPRDLKKIAFCERQQMLIERLLRVNYSVGYLLHLARGNLLTVDAVPRQTFRVSAEAFLTPSFEAEEDCRYLILSDRVERVSER